VEPTIADRPDAVPVQALRGDLEFRNLSFRFGETAQEPVLEGIDLRVPSGSSLGVVGPIGSGKSTLVGLIPRLYELEDGQLFIDGIDVNRLPLAVLRSSIAMVPQESFLFSMTLEDNITLGLERDDPVAARRAAERAQLAKDIAELPDGYDTVVGERGVMLSGGQRQRTALARALTMKPRILILDDVLSSVDAETEVGILGGLAESLGDCTVITVSHRVSAVRHADQIVVLDEGHVVEQGRHAALMRAEGLYARLARDQAEEARLDRDRSAPEMRV